MQHRMQPITVVPGASRMNDAEGKQLFDRKGRPAWSMPKPSRYVTHFISEGARRAYEAGELSLQDATHNVPVYRGFDIRVARSIRNERRRAAKKGIITRGQEAMAGAKKRITEAKKRMARHRAEEAGEPIPAHRDPAELTPRMARALVEQHNGNITHASRESGFTRDAIRRRLKKFEQGDR